MIYLYSEVANSRSVQYLSTYVSREQNILQYTQVVQIHKMCFQKSFHSIIVIKGKQGYNGQIACILELGWTWLDSCGVPSSSVSSENSSLTIEWWMLGVRGYHRDSLRPFHLWITHLSLKIDQVACKYLLQHFALTVQGMACWSKGFQILVCNTYHFRLSYLILLDLINLCIQCNINTHTDE